MSQVLRVQERRKMTVKKIMDSVYTVLDKNKVHINPSIVTLSEICLVTGW